MSATIITMEDFKAAAQQTEQAAQFNPPPSLGSGSLVRVWRMGEGGTLHVFRF